MVKKCSLQNNVSSLQTPSFGLPCKSPMNNPVITQLSTRHYKLPCEFVVTLRRDVLLKGAFYFQSVWSVYNRHRIGSPE